MNKSLIAIATTLAIFSAGTASAQVGKAAAEASDAAEHKIEQKRAEDEAKKSGPVGKAVNNAKADYHQSRSKNSAEKAKHSLKKSTD